jgi:hypothetical protein
MRPWIIDRWVNQQRLLCSIKWEFASLDSSAFGATQQPIGPIERSLWIRCLGPKVLDVCAVSIEAIHAPLAYPHSGLQQA